MRVAILSVFLMTTLLAWTQQEVPPEGIVFQAVALDEEGQEIVGVDAKGLPIKSREISVRFSILEESANGNEEYVEVHSTNTDAYGLFTLVIGEGIAQVGQFNEINWGAGFKFLKVEIDIEGGTNYRLSSIQQMFSVPYALYSKESETAGFALRSDTAQFAFNAQTSDSSLYALKSDTALYSFNSNADSTDEIQTLELIIDSLHISKGNAVDLSKYIDSIAVRLSGDTLFVNDVFVLLTNQTNTKDSLELLGDSLWIIGSNGVKLPSIWQHDSSLIFTDTNTVAIGTDVNETSAAVNIQSNTKGFLMPRLSTIERNAIPSPADGLMVFDTNTKSFWYADNGIWIEIKSDNTSSSSSSRDNIETLIYTVDGF